MRLSHRAVWNHDSPLGYHPLVRTPLSGDQRMNRLFDLSHPIENGMITYAGLPGPVIGDFLSREASGALYDGSAEFQIGKIELVANTGTYLDTPFHRFADGMDLSEIDLRAICGLDGIRVDATDATERGIGANRFAGLDLTGKAVLIRTGWDRHWRTEAYFAGHPFLTREVAELLVEAGVKLVGIDSYNIDDTGDLDRPVHTTLLGAGIPIVEHLTGLHYLPETGFRVTAVPPMIRGMGSFPVRAFAEVIS
jgi:arylformamidase